MPSRESPAATVLDYEFRDHENQVVATFTGTAAEMIEAADALASILGVAIAAYPVEVEQDAMAAYRQGFVAAAEMLAEPYPVDIFTPMDEDEVKAAVAAMNEAVPHASERLHAEWARHWSKMLLAEAEAATRDADALADLACDRETISGG